MKYIHIFIDFFANGKSNMKVYLFLTFLIGLIIFKKTIKQNKLNPNILKKIIVSLIIILYTLNIGSFIYFFKSNNIPLLSNVYVFNNQEISSTNILHNHTLKAPIGYLLEKIGINPVQEYVDTGYAFVSFYPPVFLLIVLFFVLLLLICFILYIQGQKNTFLQTFIYSIVAFSILKNIFDGGFFHIESILSITTLLILLKNNSTFQRNNQQCNVMVFLIHLVVTLCLAIISSTYLPLHGINFITEFAGKLFFFLALLTLYYSKQVNRYLLIISLIPVISIIFSAGLNDFKTQYQNDKTIIETSHEIIGYIAKPVSDIFNIDSSVNFTNTVWVQGHVTNTITKSALIKNISRDDSFNNLKIKDVDCDISVVFIRNFETRLNSNTIDDANGIFGVSKDKNNLQVIDNGCSYVNQSMLGEILKKHGIYTIILIQHDTPRI
ncbi:hypothetical protein H7Y21_01060 [Arenimonas sp.]|nr:hypothetical protein [Candidatus Parcubacteria bacterium]